MLSTWIEAPARGRQGGPVRAGMWSAVVVGTHPVEADQEVWLEILSDELELGYLPAYWIENKGVNSLWHVPIPPRPVNSRLKYRAGARRAGSEPSFSPCQEVLVRPNLPSKSDAPMGAIAGPEGLVGNRMMTVRVDERGATYDLYYPTVGLHSDVRPAEGDHPQSRSHLRAIVGGLAAGHRLDWFSERVSWEVSQRYQGTTNLLVTELTWRHGPLRVVTTDFVATGPSLPRTAGGAESPGQYLKRFRIVNDGDKPLETTFAIYVHAEVNGGIGDLGLSWQDQDRMLLASNRGHGHVNRKLARDATVEFALALDGRGPVQCEAVGPNEAMLLRPLTLPSGGAVAVDLLISGAFTGWKGDTGTYEHWLRPALTWFRAVDLDRVERETSRAWDEFIEPVPTLRFPRPTYGAALERSALAAALHADAEWGAIASGYDRGNHTYCWPRNALFTALAFDRLGHFAIGRKVFDWLGRVRVKYRAYTYWFQKYTIDGWPEWETPAVDHSALIPWALERHYRYSGDLDFVADNWPMIEQAAAVCGGDAGHPGLSWLDDLSLLTSAGLWDNRYGAFLYSNASAVAGLRAASRLAEVLDRPEATERWRGTADRLWNVGILGTCCGPHRAPGLVDPATGRFLEARRQSALRELWTSRPELLIERTAGIDISLLSPAVPFDLLPPNDPRVHATAEAILLHNALTNDPNALTRWSEDPTAFDPRAAPSEAHQHEPSSLATLWMARYLIRLGRATGEGAHWSHAVALLDDILARLCPLGLALRGSGRRSDDNLSRAMILPGVWALHTSLIEAILDIGGLEYDTPSRHMGLDPILPPAWPQVGLVRSLPCGEVGYRLERPVGATSYRLTLETRLRYPVTLAVGVTCPGLIDLTQWSTEPNPSTPRFDRSSRRLEWNAKLPAGPLTCEWTWG